MNRLLVVVRSVVWNKEQIQQLDTVYWKTNFGSKNVTEDAKVVAHGESEGMKAELINWSMCHRVEGKLVPTIMTESRQ